MESFAVWMWVVNLILGMTTGEIIMGRQCDTKSSASPRDTPNKSCSGCDLAGANPANDILGCSRFRLWDRGVAHLRHVLHESMKPVLMLEREAGSYNCIRTSLE